MCLREINCVTPVSCHTRALSPTDELFLTLMKLRLGFLIQDLVHWFIVSVTSVSRIFRMWIVFVDQQLRPLIRWSSREAIDAIRAVPSNKSNFGLYRDFYREALRVKYSVIHIFSV